MRLSRAYLALARLSCCDNVQSVIMREDRMSQRSSSRAPCCIYTNSDISVKSLTSYSLSNEEKDYSSFEARASADDYVKI